MFILWFSEEGGIEQNPSNCFCLLVSFLKIFFGIDFVKSNCCLIHQPVNTAFISHLDLLVVFSVVPCQVLESKINTSPGFAFITLNLLIDLCTFQSSAI